jgi:hypothetical protein
MKFNEGNTKTIQLNKNNKIYEIKIVVKKGLEKVRKL